MKRTSNIWIGLDKVTILLYLVLVIMGWFNIYAAVYNDEHKDILDFSQRYGKQFIWIIAAVIIATFVVLIDNRFYFFFAWFIYGALLILLASVLVAGEEINGARSWFSLGGLSLQPTEFMKFGTALALSSYLHSRRQELKKFNVIIPALAIIFFPAGLIALQPDMGSVVVYFAFFLVLFREGMSPYLFVSGLLMILLFFLTLIVDKLYLTIGLIMVAFIFIWFSLRKWKPVLAGAGIFVIIAAFAFIVNKFFMQLDTEIVLLFSVMLSGVASAKYILTRRTKEIWIIYIFLIGGIMFTGSVDYAYNNLLQPHQKERVEILLGHKTDPHGVGYNVNQSMISIGSGGFSGKGFLQGTQTKFKFVPEQSTDFVFCTVGEEWGFIGSVLVTSLYAFLLLRLIFLAERQRSFFSRIYGYCVASILFMHFFINIGMTIGLVPVIGIPLPFFSYGGSSLWGFTILLFIFLRLDASRTEYLI